MKTWTKSIEISAPIEQIWTLLNGSLEQMQQIMPNVVENRPVKITEGKVGSIYRQKYREGKRIEEYDVETLEYMDEAERKKIKVGFTLANMFEITALYELHKLNEEKTSFHYTVTNKPLKWFLKLFLVFASDKVVFEFLKRVKKVAEEESRRG